MAFYGGQQVGLNNGGQATNAFALQAGEVVTIPSGFWNYRHGLYTTAQFLDPVTNSWRPLGGDGNQLMTIHSDGTNYRLANQTGCPVAVTITNAGSGYTSTPSCTAAAGGSTYQCIVGGAISTVVTVAAGGSNYAYPPQVIIQAPPTPGIQASAYCTLSAGAVASVTVMDQGAGYTTAPVLTFVNDPRDTTGTGAIATTVLTGAQTVTGILVTNHGTPVTSLPALTVAGGGGSSAAATAIMNWTVTALTITGAGGAYSITNNAVQIQTVGTGIPTTGTAYTNPNTQAGMLRARPAIVQVTALNSTALTATGLTILDGGCIGGVAGNIGILQLSGLAIGTLATLALTVGGTNDWYSLQKA